MINPILTKLKAFAVNRAPYYCLQSPVGTGKTTSTVEFATFLMERGKTVLIVTPRTGLRKELFDKIQNENFIMIDTNTKKQLPLDDEGEPLTQEKNGGNRVFALPPLQPCVVTTYQYLISIGGGITRYINSFDFVIYDECDMLVRESSLWMKTELPSFLDPTEYKIKVPNDKGFKAMIEKDSKVYEALDFNELGYYGENYLEYVANKKDELEFHEKDGCVMRDEEITLCKKVIEFDSTHLSRLFEMRKLVMAGLASEELFLIGSLVGNRDVTSKFEASILPHCGEKFSRKIFLTATPSVFTEINKYSVTLMANFLSMSWNKISTKGIKPPNHIFVASDKGKQKAKEYFFQQNGVKMWLQNDFNQLKAIYNSLTDEQRAKTALISRKITSAEDDKKYNFSRTLDEITVNSRLPRDIEIVLTTSLLGLGYNVNTYVDHMAGIGLDCDSSVQWLGRARNGVGTYYIFPLMHRREFLRKSLGNILGDRYNKGEYCQKTLCTLYNELQYSSVGNNMIEFVDYYEKGFIDDMVESRDDWEKLPHELFEVVYEYNSEFIKPEYLISVDSYTDEKREELVVEEVMKIFELNAETNICKLKCTRLRKERLVELANRFGSDFVDRIVEVNSSEEVILKSRFVAETGLTLEGYEFVVKQVYEDFEWNETLKDKRTKTRDKNLAKLGLDLRRTSERLGISYGSLNNFMWFKRKQ